MRIISGRFKGRVLATADGPGMRPAMGKVREALFSMLAARGVDFAACRVLDLFAGSGAVGLEAVSRGAPEAVFVEKSASVAATLRANIRDLDLSSKSVQVFQGAVDAFFKKRRGEVFDCVFIDPPYGKDLLVPTLAGLVRGGFAGDGAVIAAEVELAVDPAPEDLPPQCVLLAGRVYGQTRILVWRLEMPA